MFYHLLPEFPPSALFLVSHSSTVQQVILHLTFGPHTSLTLSTSRTKSSAPPTPPQFTSPASSLSHPTSAPSSSSANPASKPSSPPNRFPTLAAPIPPSAGPPRPQTTPPSPTAARSTPPSASCYLASTSTSATSSTCTRSTTCSGGPCSSSPTRTPRCRPRGRCSRGEGRARRRWRRWWGGSQWRWGSRVRR